MHWTKFNKRILFTLNLLICQLIAVHKVTNITLSLQRSEHEISSLKLPCNFDKFVIDLTTVKVFLP